MVGSAAKANLPGCAMETRGPRLTKQEKDVLLAARFVVRAFEGLVENRTAGLLVTIYELRRAVEALDVPEEEPCRQ